MMSDAKKRKNEETGQRREKAKIGGRVAGRNVSEQSEIEQTRIEHRREADLEDKTPAGDGGVEDNMNDDEQPDTTSDGSNY